MKKSIFVFLLLSVNFIFGKNFGLAIDGAVFYFDEKNVKWEFYYSFPDNTFNYVTENEKIISKAQFRLILKSNEKIQLDTVWQNVNSVNQINDIGKKEILGTKSFIIPTGEYSVGLTITDLNKLSDVQNINYELKTKNFSNDKISLSDIQISHLIESQLIKSFDWEEQFLKKGLFILPNPSLEVTGEDPTIISYLEIYNANKISPDGVIINYILKDATKKEVLFYSRDKIADSDKLLETIQLPVNVIPTGLYFYNITVSFPKVNPTDSVSISKRIYIINKNVPLKQLAVFSEDEQFEKSEFASMIDNRIDLELRMAKKIATSEEIASAEKLGTVKAKQRFLYKFWNTRDIDTLPTINERLEKFRKSVSFANLHFPQGLKEGWDTERGEIMLKYGIPETRNIYEAVGATKAYEEWQYNTIEGGAYFYFADLSSNNGYILVHSTHPKHIYNPDWYNQYIDKNSEVNKQKYQDSNLKVK